MSHERTHAGNNHNLVRLCMPRRSVMKEGNTTEGYEGYEGYTSLHQTALNRRQPSQSPVKSCQVLDVDWTSERSDWVHHFKIRFAPSCIALNRHPSHERAYTLHLSPTMGSACSVFFFYFFGRD